MFNLADAIRFLKKYRDNEILDIERHVAFSTVISAAEKTMPKVVKNIKHSWFFGKTGICPACGRPVKSDVCHYCKQYLDWRN